MDEREEPVRLPWTIADLELITGVSEPAIMRQRLGQITRVAPMRDALSDRDPIARIEDPLISVGQIDPRDEAERLLVAQMVACYHASMECFRRAATDGISPEIRNADLKYAEKLSGTYAKLLDTLNKHRAREPQPVRVEYIRVPAEPQAIVSNVLPPNAEIAPNQPRKQAPPHLKDWPEGPTLKELGLTDD